MTTIMCGLPVAFVAMANPPEIEPVTVGVNVNEIVHVIAGATVPQVLALIVNGPDTAGAATVRFEAPALVMVKVCAALVVVTSCDGKLKVVALGLNTGAPAATPVPSTTTVGLKVCMPAVKLNV